MDRYEVIIGLEVHAQLLTESKIFSASSARYGGEPNSQTDPVVLGLPGALPVLNQRAVEFAIKMGLATHCRIAPFSRFARKQYFYPDLPKGYQISQFELPICSGGYVEIEVEGKPRRIGLTRIHLEEDAGKSIHDPAIAGEDTLVDLNRSGVPLIEIVSEPDLRSPAEAYAYLAVLKKILTYLEICDGNMEEGSLRCDANISLRPAGSAEFGVKTELKNMNSFRNVERALQFEIERQRAILSSGGEIRQETLLWDAETGSARSMRGKEEAHDYRYFPDPDLPPVEVSQNWIDELRESMPELPQARKARFVDDYQLPEYDAELLTAEKKFADFFEGVVRLCPEYKLVSNWMMSDVTRVLNERKITIEDFPLSIEQFAELLNLVADKSISLKVAKDVYEEMLVTGKSAKGVVEEKGLAQISDASLLDTLINSVLSKFPDQVQQYLDGKEKVIGFLVGQVMRESRGAANPNLVSEGLKQKLKELKDGGENNSGS